MLQLFVEPFVARFMNYRKQFLWGLTNCSTRTCRNPSCWMLLGEPLLLQAWCHYSQNSFYSLHNCLARIAGTNFKRCLVANCGHQFQTPFLSPAHGRRFAKRRRDPAVIKFGLPICQLFLTPDAVFAGNAHITDRKMEENVENVCDGHLQGVPLSAGPSCFLYLVAFCICILSQTLCASHWWKTQKTCKCSLWLSLAFSGTLLVSHFQKTRFLTLRFALFYLINSIIQ